MWRRTRAGPRIPNSTASYRPIVYQFNRPKDGTETPLQQGRSLAPLPELRLHISELNGRAIGCRGQVQGENESILRADHVCGVGIELSLVQ